MEGNEKNKPYSAQIDDKTVTFGVSAPTGCQMLEAIGRDPDHFFLVFRIPNQADQLVELDEPFDLTAPGTEEFILVSRDRHYTIQVDENSYRVVGPFITGRQILALESKDPETHFVTEILPGADDIVVDDDDRVDLSKLGVERFTVVARPCEIIVNTRRHPFSGFEISFEQVVRLAFDTSGDDANTVYTVAYTNGGLKKPVGSMVKGDHVKVRCGEEFDVDRTNRS